MSKHTPYYKGRPAKKKRIPFTSPDSRVHRPKFVAKNNLIELRTMRGFSQKELAKMVGVSESSVCLWEYQVRSISDDAKMKLCKALGCTIRELIDWGDIE